MSCPKELSLWGLILSEFQCSDCLRNSMLKLLYFVRFGCSLEHFHLLLSMRAISPVFVSVQDSLSAVGIELEHLCFHSLVLPIDDNSFPSQNWGSKSIRPSPVDNGVIVRLFNMSNWSQLSSSFPVILCQVSFCHVVERKSILVIQLHDRRVSMEFLCLIASMKHVVIQSIRERSRHSQIIIFTQI